MARKRKVKQPTMTLAEVDAALEATDRLLHKSRTGRLPAKATAKSQRPKAGKPPPVVWEKRKVFVYARDLRVGDVISVHGSRPIGSGAWENTTVTGSILSVTAESLYSKTIVTLVDKDWPEIVSEHRLHNESYMHLVSAPDGV